MAQSRTPKSYIVRTSFPPVRDMREEAVEDYEKHVEPLHESGSIVETAMEDNMERYIFRYPSVYIINTKNGNDRPQYEVYVGETNNIETRTMQHLNEDPKTMESWKKFQQAWESAAGKANNPEDPPTSQFVIGNSHFNKSLTLDIENRLIGYLTGSKAVSQIYNGRTNPQGDYYTSAELNAIFSDIWMGLHKRDPRLFPSEQIIRDSALFKASPFQKLGEQQMAAEESILDTIQEVLEQDDKDFEYPTLILLSGAAGTGKTVLLSHLFYRMMTETLPDSGIDPKGKAFLLVNHNQQCHVYSQIATKLGLQKGGSKNGDAVVMKPVQLLNKVVDKSINPEPPKERKIDVLFVDEAHLLNTQYNQAFRQSISYSDNMLLNLLDVAKVVVAVFDPHQILQSNQRWGEDMIQLFSSSNTQNHAPNQSEPVVLVHESPKTSETVTREVRLRHLTLDSQFRMDAPQATIDWIHNFVQGRPIGVLPDGAQQDGILDNGEERRDHQPYELKVFESPVALMDSIRNIAEADALLDLAKSHGLSRVVATYDWPYKGGRKTKDDPSSWNVELFYEDGQWKMPANVDTTAVFDSSTHFCQPWNYEMKDTPEEKQLNKLDQLAWPEIPHTINEIGSTFSIQGFDLNFAGVILGPSIGFDPETKQIIIRPQYSESGKATQKRNGTTSYAEDNLRNELNVLMTRGVHGLYLFAVDPQLQRHLLDMQRMRDEKRR